MLPEKPPVQLIETLLPTSEASHQAPPSRINLISDLLVVGAQIYIAASFLVVICRISADALAQNNTDTEHFFSESQLFLYTLSSSLEFAAYPLITGYVLKPMDHWLNQLIARCKKEQKKATHRPITDLIQKKGMRFDSSILAVSMAIALPMILIPNDDASTAANSSLVTYESLELRAVDYTKIWLLFVSLSFLGTVIKDFILIAEALWQKYMLRDTSTETVATCFRKAYDCGDRHEYALVEQTSTTDHSEDTEQSMPSFIINVDLDRTIYRHNPIADAIAQSIIAVIAISMFILVMIQTICVTNVDYVLDMVADNIVGNLGGNNSDLTTFTNFTGLCGPDSACLIGADLLDGLWFMGPSSSPRNQANDLSGPSAFLNPSLLANISHVPHIPNPYNSSLYIPLTATPENIARLYGILLALPQEIQAYCAVGVVYITLPIATIVISRQKKPFGCSQQKYHSYAAPASRFVKGMHQAVHYCKATVLGLYGLVLFAFRQENLLPHSQYQDPLWSAAGFYGKQWLKALGQTLIFQPTTAAEDIHPNSHEAYQIQLAILAWGTAWTAFLAWAPPVMFASMIFLGIKANFCCEKRDEIPLVTTIKVSRLFQTTRGPHALINVLDEDSSSGCGVNDTTELDAEIPTTPSHGGTSPQGTKTPNGTP